MALGDKIYRESIVIDSLAGVTFSFDQLLQGGITAANITLSAHNEGFLRAIENIKDYYAALEVHSDQLLLVLTAEDIYRAKAEGKLGIIFGFQSSSPIEDDLTNLWIFAQLGIRIIQLTYMTQNLVGYGCYEDKDNGLTYFGKTVIREMNRLGLLIDLSHSGWRTAEDATVISQKPVVFTHSNPYSKCANRRNIPDELIKAVADKGGVVGINAHPALCALRSDEQPTIQDYLDILDYTVDLAGIDHVGLGPDLFDGFAHWQAFRWDRRYDELDTNWSVTKGIAREVDIPKIAVELAKRRYTETDIRKILGLNFLRVFENAWTNHPIRR